MCKKGLQMCWVPSEELWWLSSQALQLCTITTHQFQACVGPCYNRPQTNKQTNSAAFVAGELRGQLSLRSVVY